MAILNHIASKNVDYGEAQRYLMFQHDEYTGKPMLDENGRLIPREEYYLDGINCNPFTFDMECKELNAQYGKNQAYDEIKSHHYILSFDPKDAPENGLTGSGAAAWSGICPQKFSRTSGSCLYPYRRTQRERQYPCAYRHQQPEKVRRRTAAIYGTPL